METVHFIDEHSLHYEALVSRFIDENTANLYVWAYGHVRIIEQVPYSATNAPVSWHRAHMQADGKSICEGNGGFVYLDEGERKKLQELASGRISD